jgi:multisubunit Na+/H+ antiporter MnhE subunit
MLTRIITYIVFVAIWCGLAGLPTKTVPLLFTIFAPLVTLLLTIWLGLLPKKNYFKFSAIIYFGWLLKEILMSSIAVVRISWRKNMRLQPLLEPIETIQKNQMGVVTYANSITLTPGTVTLSTENKHLLVHALDISFMDDLKDGEMDNRVKRIIE